MIEKNKKNEQQQKNQTKKTKKREKYKATKAVAPKQPVKKGDPHISGRVMRSMASDNDFRWNYGAGSRPNIMINPEIDAKAVECAPLGVLSIALSKGYKNDVKQIFSAYIAFMQDLIAIASNQTSPVFGRLAYLNSVLGSLIPKSIPFKTGTLTYAWNGVNTVQTINAVDVRGYKFYLYVPGNSVNPAGWPIMDPPSIPADQVESLNALSYLYNIIGNEGVPHLNYCSDISLTDTYKKDVSSFAAGSPYYGASNAPSSAAAYSIESEAHFKSSILAGYTPYDPADGRVGKKFSLATGDTTAGLAVALLPGFFPELYDTCYPISYSYLDLDEVVFFLQYWFRELAAQAIANNVNTLIPNEVLLALQPFTYSPQQFRIAIAACIRSMFSTSQSIGQFLTFSTDARGFEPLRMGTNCFGQNRDTINVPINFAENMRMLQPHVLDIKSKFYNPKNQWILSPVWGVMNSANPINVDYQGLGNEGAPYYGPLFTGSSANDPSVIDGTLGGNCLDLNCSLVQELITEWNLRIAALKQYAGNTCFLEGSSAGCLLFQTRFAQYSAPTEKILMSSISPFMRNKIPTETIQKIERKKAVTRSLSSKDMGTIAPDYDEYFVPINGSLYTQTTSAFSSVPAFTTAQKTLINYLIYPIVVIEQNQPPTTQQVRITEFQANFLPIDQPQGSIVSRATDLASYAAVCAPGVAAADTDELSSLLKQLGNTGNGGFLKDVCVALAGLIPW